MNSETQLFSTLYNGLQGATAHIPCRKKPRERFEAPSGVIAQCKNYIFLLLILSMHVWAYLCCYSLWYSAVDWKKNIRTHYPSYTLSNILQWVWVNHLKHLNCTQCVIGTTVHNIPCTFCCVFISSIATWYYAGMVNLLFINTPDSFSILSVESAWCGGV